jgi:hypothetical protein
MVTPSAPYQALAAGDVVSLNFIAKYFPINAVSLAKGKLLAKIGASNLAIAPTTAVAGSKYYVSIEAKDNSGGADGALSIGVASSGDQVAVQTTTALIPGDPVKSSTTVAGCVEKFIVGTDAEGLKVGYYVGKEAGVFARSGSTPYAETISGSRILPSDAAINDIVAIELR